MYVMCVWCATMCEVCICVVSVCEVCMCVCVFGGWGRARLQVKAP